VADFFGTSVAVSGDTVVVGALHAEIGGNESQGSAYVFVKPAEGWVDTTETAKLTASDGAAEERFGVSVAVSGDTIVAGKFLGGNSRQGPAYVFVKPAGGRVNMIETAQLTASDGEPNSSLGESVAVSGDTVVVGGFPAYVFVKPTDGWAGLRTESAKLRRGGLPVAVSGDSVVAGILRFTKPVGGWAGVVRETAVLTASDGSPADAFGFSVGVSGDTVVVGAPFKDNDQGSAYVFVEFEVTVPATRIDCKTGGCKVLVTCNIAQDVETRCRNRINLFVRASAARLRDDPSAKPRRRIKFAFGISNIPPGETNAAPAHAEG